MSDRPGRRRLLLSGAGAATAAALPAEAQQAPAGSVNALTSRANAGTVGVVSGGVDGTYVRIASDLASVLDNGDGLRVLPILGKGSVQNISDIMLLRGVDLGIVQSDALAYARSRKLLPGVGQMIQYVAKLYDEEIHVLARQDVASLADLAGQAVNVDVAGSGTAMTAALLFEMLGIQVRRVQDSQDVALARLRAGEIAALVYVAGKPARLFAGIPPGSGLHFLAVPATEALIETYLPSGLAAADYPALIPEGGSVDTIAVGAVMAVYAWAPGTERHRKVARFVEAFQDSFPAFLRPPRHPKWRDVNLSAQVPGWTRFAGAAPPSR